MEAQLKRKLLAAYAPLPAGQRWFVKVRLALSDLPFVESFLPQEGLVVELGCGHGLFSILAALRAPQRQVIGIDLSANKVEIARSTHHPANVVFEHGDALTYRPPSPADAVAIVDVLYLLEPHRQRQVLENAYMCLRPGGVLVWKAQETRPRWKYWWTYVQEWLMTSSGLTLRPDRGLHFLPREEALDILKAVGFRARAVDMRSWRPYSDILYLAYKPGSSH
jgi:SAM-dependent methyltransferase